MNEVISDKIIEYLEVDRESITGIKISYYLETIIAEMEKLIILTGIFAIMGYFTDILLIIGILLMVRTYTGGTHQKTFIGCLLKTFVFCLIPVLALRFVPASDKLQLGISILLIAVILVFGAVISEYRNVYTDKALKKMRVKGIVGVVIANCIYFCMQDKYKIEITVVMLLLFADILSAKILVLLRK